ncbi:iron complex outermembrane recepter protein [Novimethylophilus kurashikiensis]|uniref:Iron complex outermembrane recepter protein n=1 Tax=Novimethylophilus kurashikiensis TaxID=1825523 RepID=A0A2R5F6B5_9PROT|nr:TonB-dependent receptor [Novimethylophilus kurashikiensis]GBG12493.1 iron complex outermembrane recepter protein [Novimethylophilus kurashikiensis]
MQYQLKRMRPAILLALAALPLQAAAEDTKAEQTETLPEVQVSGQQDRSLNYQVETTTTGSKTDTPARDVPASIVVVPKAVLEDQGAMGMNEAMRNVSGVSQNYAGGYGFADNFNIRGLNMRWLRDGNVDGSTQNGYYRTMTDVERIEVLKGPGSALYGSSQPGGSVNVVTKLPTDKTVAEFEVGVGSYDTQRVGLDLGGAVNGVATRLNVGYEKSDDFRGLGREITEILPSLRFNLTDTQTLTLDYDYRDIKLTPDNYGIVFGADRKLVTASGRNARYYSPMDYANQEINRLATIHEWKPSDAFSLKTSLVYDHRDIDMLRNAGSNVANASGVITGRTIRSQQDDADYLDFTSEATWKFKTGSVSHTLLAGVEWQDTDIDTVRVGYNLSNIANASNPVVPETSLNGLTAVASQGFNRHVEATTKSVYAQDQVELTEQVKLRGGLRHDNVDFSDEGSQGTTAFRRIADEQGLNSSQFGAVYQPIPQLSLYAGIARGAFINIATESTALSPEPEKSFSKEVGAKAMLLDGRLDLNVALFRAKRDHYYVTLTPGVSTPDGKDKTSGIEVDAVGSLTREVKLLASYSHINPKSISDALSSNTTLGVGNTSIYGNMPTGVAKDNARVWLTWEPSMLHGFGAGIGATYKGKSYADALNLLEVPSYTVYDAAVYWRQKTYEIAVNFKNLTDKTYYTVPTFIGALPGDPRSVMATVRFDFN